jgi:hypothetical protein
MSALARSAMSTPIEVTNWKALNKGSLVGLFSVVLPSGLILHECSLFVKGEKRWINGPQKTFKTNGETKYTPMLEFIDRATSDRFRDSVIAALDLHLKGGR